MRNLFCDQFFSLHLRASWILLHSLNPFFFFPGSFFLRFYFEYVFEKVHTFHFYKMSENLNLLIMIHFFFYTFANFGTFSFDILTMPETFNNLLKNLIFKLFLWTLLFQYHKTGSDKYSIAPFSIVRWGTGFDLEMICDCSRPW